MMLREILVPAPSELHPLNERVRNLAQKLFSDLEKGFFLELPENNMYHSGEAMIVGISDGSDYFGIVAGYSTRKRDERTGQVLSVGKVDPITGRITQDCILISRIGFNSKGNNLDRILDSLNRASVDPTLTRTIYEYCISTGESVRWPSPTDQPRTE